MKKFINVLCVSAIVFGASVKAQEIVLPKQAPIPKDNLMSEAKIDLGRKLFFDPRISKNGAISCNSCHNVMAGGEDNRKFSVGVGGKLGGRSAPTVWNSAFNSVQFWDGRAATLEDQAKGPMTNPVEMGMENHNLVVGRLGQIPGYVESFKSVFPDSKTITIDNAAKAIAAYERTLITPNSRFDKYLQGNKKIINEQELRGFQLAKTVGCMSCHSGANFSGPQLPVGTGFYMKFPVFPNTEIETKYQITKDLGRFEVTKNESDKHFYRVPTWRNIALTAPYFHNGSAATLDEAVKVMAKAQLNRDLSKDEAKDIVAFLKTLTGERPVQKMPILPSTDGMSIVETN